MVRNIKQPFEKCYNRVTFAFGRLLKWSFMPVPVMEKRFLLPQFTVTMKNQWLLSVTKRVT